LSVLIPVYNEAKNVECLVDKVQAVAVDKEIIIVDDGSSDGTGDLIRNRIAPRYANVKPFFHPTNRGKGAAIRTAIAEASGELSIIQDADLEYDPNDYAAMIVPILAGKANVVYGSRYMNSRLRDYIWAYMTGKRERVKGWHAYPHHLIGIHLLNAMVAVLYGARITDEATCYKAFRTPLLKSLPLRCEGFEFCPEVTARVLKLGEKIVEVPVRYQPRTEGKKLNWKHGIEAIWTLLKYRFVN
jgi:glycosyltransferase involved in cell wall biosynthesis